MTEPTPGHELRTLLEDAVSDVEPRLGLEEIRARTAGEPHRRPWLRGAVTAAVAVAATAATVAAVTVVTDRSPEQRADTTPAASASADPTPSATTTSEAPSVTPSEEATPAPTTSSTALLPVYYVGQTPAGPRLFREWATPTGAGDDTSRMLQALRDAVMGTPADPDYATPWPQGWSVERTGLNEVGGRQVIEIAVRQGPGASPWPPDNAVADGRLALQQLVYTAQAVLQQRLPVQFVGEDGLPLRTLLGVDVAQPVGNAPEMQVQAPVWIIDPAQDAVVGRTFTVSGRGAFFEANVSWQLLAGQRVVRHGFSTAAEGMTLSPYSFTVSDVPPGTYTLRVYDADMSGGEGNGEQQDTKEVVVR